MSTNDQQITEQMQYIGGLFFRRLHEELTAPEQAELDAWLDRQQPADRRFFEEMTDWEQIQAALQYMYRIDVPAALADVQKKILYDSIQETPVVAMPRRTSPRILSYKYVTAAAIVGLVIGGAVIYTLLKKKDNLAGIAVSERFKNDVAPGSEKAILVLADGRRIALDSLATGTQVQEGTTSIRKDEGGQVLYDPNNKRPAGASPEVVDLAVGFNTVSTPRGGQYRVVLPDGSKVWLNAASSLRFPTAFAGTERKVELTGEAYFEVAKNATMPFRVMVNPAAGAGPAQQVEVLGTEFDINAYGDESDSRTTLVQGAVKISAGNEHSVLRPGEQARIAAGKSSIQVVPGTDTDEVIAWKNGLFQFKEANIQSIMRQVARWYDVDIAYEGKVDQQFFGKIPRRVQVSTLLKILESTGWVHFTIDGKKITVAP